jgi:hypothetical protein
MTLISDWKREGWEVGKFIIHEINSINPTNSTNPINSTNPTNSIN